MNDINNIEESLKDAIDLGLVRNQAEVAEYIDGFNSGFKDLKIDPSKRSAHFNSGFRSGVLNSLLVNK